MSRDLTEKQKLDFYRERNHILRTTIYDQDEQIAKLQKKVEPDKDLKDKYDRACITMSQLYRDLHEQKEEVRRFQISEQFQLEWTDIYLASMRNLKPSSSVMSFQTLSREEEITRSRIVEEFQRELTGMMSEISKIQREQMIQIIFDEQNTRSHINEEMYLDLIDIQSQNMRPHVDLVKSETDEDIPSKPDITNEFEMWRPILKIENVFMWTGSDITIARVLREVLVVSEGATDNYTELVRRLRIKSWLTESLVYSFLRNHLRKPSTSRGVIYDIKLLPE